MGLEESKMSKSPLKFTVSLFAIFASAAASAEEVDSLSEIFEKGDADIDFRYRLETVDQDGFNKNATASTLLTKLKYKTASFNGFSGYLEATNTTVIGKETYNNTVNGNTTRPVVADPETTELNQAYLQYGSDWGAFKIGRQGVNLDNQRFIGTVGFRQNDQTYDAGAVILTPIEGMTTLYGYVWNVNRIFGKDHPFGDLDTHTHLINISYKGIGPGKLSAYGYFVDLNDTAVFGLSSRTLGVRYAGKTKITENAKVGYELEYANQADCKDNPGDYSADYWHAGLNVSASGFTVGAGYELLGSDNGISFKTPLATLHKFNGWADKFLGTPANGLQDFYASAAYKVPGDTALGGFLFKAVYHDFKSDVGDVKYGTEWDFLISKKIGKHFTASVKAAFYNADTHATDTNKVWFTIGAKF